MKRSLETSEKSTKKPKISLEPDVSELGDSDLDGMPSEMQSSLELDVREMRDSDLYGMPSEMQSSLIKLASAQESYVALSNRNSLNSELRSAEQELEKAYLAIRDLFFDTDNYSFTSVVKLLQLGFDPNIENSRGVPTLLQVLLNNLVLTNQLDHFTVLAIESAAKPQKAKPQKGRYEISKIVEESEVIFKLLSKHSTTIKASDIYNFNMDVFLSTIGIKAFKIYMNQNVPAGVDSLTYTPEKREIAANYGSERYSFMGENSISIIEEIVVAMNYNPDHIDERHIKDDAQALIDTMISITKHFGCFVSNFWKAKINDDKKITDYMYISSYEDVSGFVKVFSEEHGCVREPSHIFDRIIGPLIKMSDLCSTLDIAYKAEMGITLFPSEIKFKKSREYNKAAAKEQATLAQEQLAAIKSFIPAVVRSKLKQKQNNEIIEAEKSATKCVDCDEMLRYILQFLPRNELNKITYARKEVQESKNLLKDKISSIESKGYSVQDVSGDGNCFFHAVALALQDSNHNAAGLRAMAIDYILNHPRRFQGFVEHNLDAYIDDMVGDGTWADNPVIQALSLALNRPITIFHINGREININDSIENSDIHLLYTGNHYMSITPTTHNPSEEVTIERSSHTVDDFTTVLMQSSSTTSEEATQDIESMHSKLAKSNQLEFSVDQGISSIIENMFGSGQNSLDDLIGTKESYALEASNRGFFDSFGNVVDYLSNKLSSLLDIEVEGSAVEATVLQLQALLTMAGSGNMPMGIPNRYNPDDDDGDFEPYFGGGNGGIVSFDNTPELPQNIQIVTILGNGTLVVAEDSHNTQ